MRSVVIQAKLASGASVAGSGSPPSVTALQSHPNQSGILQRQCSCGGAATISEECDTCRTKKRSGPQTKLKVSTPGDIYEQEADRVANSVLSKPEKPLVSEGSPRIQRFADSVSVGANTAPASVSAALASSANPLKATLRQDMEQRFGHNFSRGARPYRRRCRPICRRRERSRLHGGAQHRFWRGQVRAGDAGRAAIVSARTHSCRSTRARYHGQLPDCWTGPPSHGGSIAARPERGRERSVG